MKLTLELCNIICYVKIFNQVPIYLVKLNFLLVLLSFLYTPFIFFNSVKQLVFSYTLIANTHRCALQVLICMVVFHGL